MATASESSPVAITPATGQRVNPATRFAAVVDRTTELSEGTIQALEDSSRAAVDAVGRFVVTVEDALPRELDGTSEAAKKITESGLEMVDRLVQTQSDFLRRVVESASASLRSASGAKPNVVK